MRFFCLVNPFSGGQHGERLLELLEHASEQGHIDAQVEAMKPDSLGDQMERAYECDRLLIAGGDGTVTALVPHLLGRSLPLGVLPLGTGNDLARELGVFHLFSPRDPFPLVNFYSTAQPRSMSVWRLSVGPAFSESLLFCNYVSFGFDAEAAIIFDKLRRAEGRWLGRLGVWANRMGYVVAGLSSMLRRRMPEVAVMDGTGRTHSFAGVRSLVFPNIASYMGLGLSHPQSNSFDRRLEGLVVRSVINYFAMLLRYRLPVPAAIRLEGGESWEISVPAGTAVQRDGEAHPELVQSSYRISYGGEISILAKSP